MALRVLGPLGRMQCWREMIQVVKKRKTAFNIGFYIVNYARKTFQDLSGLYPKLASTIDTFWVVHILQGPSENN
jgi:hypothetical protein